MPITLDVFNNDAFGITTMLPAVEKMPYKPSFLAQFFEDTPVATDTVGIGSYQGRLALIRTTLRGAPIEAAEPDAKNIRPFLIPRIAKGDKLFAHELANVIPDPAQTEVEAAAAVLARKQQRLKQDVEYTWEHMRLGAIQGIVLDADGTTELVNYWTEWGVAQPSEIDLDLVTANNGALRTEINDSIHRPLIRAAQAEGGVRRVVGLAGDVFWDKLLANPEVRATYLSWSAAADMREAAPFETFRYGGVDWINYRGSDDGTSIAIPDDDAVVFPVGVPGMFQHVMGPMNERFETQNMMGRAMYPLIVRDNDRDMWVQPEIYAYSLMVNTRPDLIVRVTSVD